MLYSHLRASIGSTFSARRAGNNAAMPPTDPSERALMAALSREPRHVDDIVRASGLAAATVSGTLALLELKGLVRDLGGMQYVRVREDAADYVAEPLGGEA